MISTTIDTTANATNRMTSPKVLARIAGILYLLVGVCGGFAQGVIYPKVYVAGDAASTAAALIANSGFVRMAVVADFLDNTAWVFLALVLYRMLKQVNKNMASAMVVLVAIGAGITMLNAVFEFEALRVATGVVNVGALSAAGSNAVALLLVDAQHYGLLTAQIFFGLWLVPLGYLAYRSGWFPKTLGVGLIVGAAGYLADVLAAFLVPDLGKAIHGYVTIPSAVAEIWMVGYLLVIGVKTKSQTSTFGPPRNHFNQGSQS
jgi:hypothetical protein